MANCAHSRCNHGNRRNILLRPVHSHQPQSFLLIPFQPSKKGNLYRRTVLSSRHGQGGLCRGV